MATQQTLKQMFAAVQRKKTATAKPLRQTTLNFDGCAPPANDYRELDCYSDGSCPCDDHTEMMNDEWICICKREGCDYDADPQSCGCNSCWEARVEEDPTLRFYWPRAFHEEHESSYADELWDKMTPRRGKHIHHVYYDHRKPQDLKKFVAQRGLRDAYPNGTTLKYYYLKELLPSDRESVFRFLDLPAEMRNAVYGHLLSIPGRTDSGSRKCFPQILSTCRQVSEEATEILYADNVVSCGLAHKPDYPNSMTIFNKPYSGAKAADFARLPAAIDHFPDFLTRIRQLKVDINIDFADWQTRREKNASADFVRSALLALASKIMDSRRLKKLQVTIRTSSTMKPEVVASILYPLRRLRNVEAKFDGDAEIPDFLREDMATEMRQMEPVFNTLKQCCLVFSEAEAYLSLVALVVSYHDGSTVLPGASSKASVISREVKQLKSKMTGERSLFADWLGEVKVQTHLAKLQEQLALDLPMQAQALLNTWTMANKERRGYQETEQHRWSIGDLARAGSPSPEPAPLQW